MEEQRNVEEVSAEHEVYELTEEGRAKIREGLAEARAHRKPGRKGLVIVNTGNGKGKTSAALGVLMRSWGQNMSGVMLQFLKSQTGNWGEIKAAQRMGIEIIPLGDGFTWLSQDLEHDRALAQTCWQLCREKIESGKYDVVIMDEITYAINYGWLNLDEILTVLRHRSPELHVVLTGRDAPQALIDFADLVTEMREIKHPYKEGIMAQKGIDF
ncbi:cob(I)yrinic acid a,c-diamide adenosyltransferase [Tengunoibacter tsumagoiensis]|uniref:Cob(I)alamin adenosyltransferase n=1 Tax=Tengunoibacter tsumagoiensis TaxID=2014871 RepID=A0A401ZYT4_9CHLR|nr:cob(I)yrinic acid a,c-diamide adenosyltransferase [Tengunoibacter tsumagoiensis]GCE11982.1 cob(I)alamin adenosyltransferase [Tengunoibacter tsumagoiensis]